MKAIQVSEFGGPDVLQVVDMPDPDPGDDAVLIDVSHVEVGFLDTRLRAGWGQEYFPLQPPWVPGSGVAGTIAAVGAHVPQKELGRRVVGRTGDIGAYAERAVTPLAHTFDVPDGLDPAVALAALHDAPLALSRLELVRLRRGDRVLVTAAAGSLGHWFVPLAVAAGATVVGTAAGDEKTRVVAELGAAQAVDYRRPGWADELGEAFDVVFDGTGGEVGRTAYAHTRDGGRFSAHGSASGEFGAGAGRDIEVVGVERQLTEDEWRRYTERGLELLAAGTIRPTIGQVIPLAKAADAHRAIANRTVIGKTVLEV